MFSFAAIALISFSMISLLITPPNRYKAGNIKPNIVHLILFLFFTGKNMSTIKAMPGHIEKNGSATYNVLNEIR